MDENLKSPDGPSVDLSDRADHLSNIVNEKSASQYASDRALLKAVNRDDRPELGHMLSDRFINEAEKRERQSRDIFWEEFKKAVGYYALRDSLHGDKSRAKLLDDTKKDAKRFIEQYINNNEGKGTENRQALRDILVDYINHDSKTKVANDDKPELKDVPVETEEELKNKAERQRRTRQVDDFFDRSQGRLTYDQCIERYGYNKNDID